jgi:hypothetical protein
MRGSVTPDPVSQSVNTPAYHGNSSKERLLVSVARQVLLSDDLIKIIYCLGNSFQDQFELTYSTDPGPQSWF